MTKRAIAVFRTNHGKALTDEANVYFAGIIGKADDRLTSGVAEQRANTGWLRIVSAIGALVIVAVIGGAAYCDRALHQGSFARPAIRSCAQHATSSNASLGARRICNRLVTEPKCCYRKSTTEWRTALPLSHRW